MSVSVCLFAFVCVCGEGRGVSVPALFFFSFLYTIRATQKVHSQDGSARGFDMLSD